MDERKLGELFREAVPDAPPPSFGHSDITAESYRQRATHRRALMGGSVLAVAILAVAGLMSVALWKGTGTENGLVATDSSGNGQPAPNEVPSEGVPRAAAGGGTSDESFSAESPKQGGTPTGNAGPAGPGSTPRGCDKADPELAAALAGELRAAPSSAVPAASVYCPPGGRGVTFVLTGGTVSVVVAPPNAEFGNPANGRAGAVLRVGIAGDGRRAVLISEPPAGGGPAPFQPQLQGIADRIASSLR